MVRVDLAKEIHSYFSYIGIDEIYKALEGMESLDQALTTQCFLDIVENGEYTIGNKDTFPVVTLDVSVPENIQPRVQKLVSLYECDNFFDFLVERVNNQINV